MEERLTLTELQLMIRDSLYLALPDFYWVAAEISELKENYAGHCYLELIEKHPDEKNVRARVRAVIWGNRYNFLKSLFRNIAGDYLAEGMKVLVKAKVEYHEVYGLSLVISDIDPSYTIGEMALKRQMIVKRLEEEGVFDMNREMSFPVLPQRIAVISSRSAAGYADFINHLSKNSSGYVFYTALYDTVMQGTETEESVINSLDRIAGRADLFDVVAIIRGGGSVSDLSWFDNYKIAYHITQFPLPVITGIGHEKDLSVADMVAFKSLKTPTAVADHLIECMTEAELHLEDMSNQITELSRFIIEENMTRLDTSRMKLIPVSRLMLSDNKERLSGNILKLTNFGKEFIVSAGMTSATQKLRLNAVTAHYSSDKNMLIKNLKLDLPKKSVIFCTRVKEEIDNYGKRLSILDPVNVLSRGYTITSVNNRIIKSVDQISEDDLIDTRFSDGNIKSRILKKNNKPRRDNLKI